MINSSVQPLIIIKYIKLLPAQATTTEEDEEGNTMRNQLRHLMINYCNIFSPFSCLLHNHVDWTFGKNFIHKKKIITQLCLLFSVKEIMGGDEKF